MTGIDILGTGSFLPEKTVVNDDYTRFVDTSDEWIRTRTGMQERHIATDEPTWYMATQAAKRALDAAGAAPEELEAIILTTVTSDYTTPSAACLVQNQIGAVNAFAFDISVACTGLAYAMEMAWRYLNTGMERILLVCAESLSQITNYEDRSTCVLFGDGAGAAVLGKKDGMFGSYCRSDASGIHHLYSKKPRKTHPFSDCKDTAKYDWFEPEWLDGLYMAGQPVYKFATRAMPLAVEKACEKAGIAPTELDLIIPHQANIRIIETAMKHLQLPLEKMFVNIHKSGNCSSATMALGLDQCVREGRMKRGDKVCLVGMGAGLTYGSSVFEY